VAFIGNEDSRHSNEAIEADDDGDLPIHDVLRFLTYSMDAPAPLSLLQC
jgi:hypothetical protein